MINIVATILASSSVKVEENIFGIHYFNASCNGSESSILDCDFTQLTNQECISNQTAAVVCEGMSLVITK